MVRLIHSGALLALTSSFLTHAYIIDFTCDCYDFVEESMESAFNLAKNAYDMLDAAKKDTSNSDPKTQAVKALSSVMFGKDDGAWTLKKFDMTAQDVYQRISVDMFNKKISYEETHPPTTVITQDDRKRPEKGWATKIEAYEYVVYCDNKNWTPADKKQVYDWAFDSLLTSKLSKEITPVMDRCMGKLTLEGREMAFTYSLSKDRDITEPAQVSQVVLCPWFLNEMKEKKRTNVGQLKAVFDQFKGDPATRSEKFKNFLKDTFKDASPEIERYMPLDQVILHELTHMPFYGKSKDVGSASKCYGWRNCAKLAKTDEGRNNADSLAYFALALWFVSQDVCVTKNGNLVPSESALKSCGAAEPTLGDSTKKQDEQWEQQAQQEDRASLEIQAESSTVKGSGVFHPNFEVKREDDA